MADHTSRKQPRGEIVLRTIGIYKLIKGALLLVLAFTTLHVRHIDIIHALNHVALHLHIAPGNVYFSKLIEKAWSISNRQLDVWAAVMFVYAALFFVEGVGLTLKKQWAEWLTVITTMGLIPFEIYEIFKHPGPVKIIALVINMAVAIYLIVRLRHELKIQLESKIEAELKRHENSKQESESKDHSGAQ